MTDTIRKQVEFKAGEAPLECPDCDDQLTFDGIDTYTCNSCGYTETR